MSAAKKELVQRSWQSRERERLAQSFFIEMKEIIKN
jgi:hypothetical protein